MTTTDRHPGAIDAWDVAYDVALETLPTLRAAGQFGNTPVYGAIASGLAAAGYGPDALPAPEVAMAVATAADTLAERARLAAALGL